MRAAYTEELTALCAQTADMCGLAATAMEHATDALLDADLPMAEQVFADHEHLAAMRRDAEAGAFRLLALQQPVAGDLRAVVGSMHIAADTERMGALALHVAKIARLRHPDCAVPDAVRDCFAELASERSDWPRRRSRCCPHAIRTWRRSCATPTTRWTTTIGA